MFLMHRDHLVAELSLRNGSFAVERVLDEARVPFELKYESLLSEELNDWLYKRSIPKDRQDIGRIESAIGMQVKDSFVRSMNVSITDCYWISNSDRLKWSDVNYHENGFGTTFTNFIFSGASSIGELNYPDFATNGSLSKAWTHHKNIPILLKRGQIPWIENGKNILSANEVAASKISKMLGVKHADVIPIKINSTGEVVCGSVSIIRAPDVELIPASIATRGVHGVELFRALCDLGFENPIKDMIFFDYIMCQTDRHSGNFGFIRDAETLSIIGVAPLFDSGLCLDPFKERKRFDPISKPFIDNPDKQVGLLSRDELVGRMDVVESKMDAILAAIESSYESFGLSDEAITNALDCLKERADRVPYIEKRMEVDR